MRRIGWTGIGMAVAMMIGGGAQLIHAGDDNGGQKPRPRRCSAATLRGDWGIQIQGTRPAGPNQPNETVIGVVLRTYDGSGNFTQLDNVHGSVSGTVPDRPGFGTYHVNENCTGVAFLQLPNPPFSIEERLVIVDDGNEMRTAVVDPATVMVSGVHRRVRSR